MAAGLTSVPKIKKRSYNSGDGSSAAARGGRGRGRGSGPYGSLRPPPLSEPEFGWQQKQTLRNQPGGDDDGHGYGDALEQEDFVTGFDDGGVDVDVEGFGGGWAGGQEEEKERHSGGTGAQAEEAGT